MELKNIILREKWFVVSFLACLSIKLAFLDPSLTYSPEIWAEAATNYFSTPFDVGFWKSFFTLDFGYLPLWPRIIASFTYLFSLSSKNVTLIYQIFSILFICFSTSYIALKNNAHFIKSDILRFFLSILFSFLLDYELHTFINFSYWGLIPVSFYLLSNFFVGSNNSKSCLKLTMGVLVIITLLSKAMMVSLLPLLIIIFFHNKDKRKYASVLISAVFFQLIITLLNAPTDNGYQLPKNIIETLKNVLMYFFTFPFLSFLPPQSLVSGSFPIYTLAGIISMIALIFAYKKRESKYLLISIFLSYGFSLLITLKAYPKIFHISQFQTFPIELLKTRLLFFPVIYMYTALFWFVSDKLENLRNRKLYYPLLIVFLLFIFSKNPSFNLTTLGRLKSFPEVHHSLFESSQNPEIEPCLPINPYPWHLNTRNCSLIPSELSESSFITIPKEQSNSPFLGIHLYSKVSLNDLSIENLNLDVVDSNGNIYKIAPQIRTANMIRWKFASPLVIKSVQVSITNFNFSNDQVPTIKLIGAMP